MTVSVLFLARGHLNKRECQFLSCGFLLFLLCSEICAETCLCLKPFTLRSATVSFCTLRCQLLPAVWHKAGS